MAVPALNTPYQVIYSAYRNAGLTSIGQDPDSEQIAEGMNRLNNLMNMWQTDGLRLWLQFDLSIGPPILTAGVNFYTLGPAGTVIMTRPTRIIEGYYLEQNSNSRRPLIPLSRNEWDTLSTTISRGAINSYFIDKQVATLNVYLWLTPDSQAALGQVHVIIQQQQPNVINLTESMVFGPEWFLGLSWGLANEMCTGQPQAIMDRCANFAGVYKEKLDAWDVEDTSTMFTPDTRQTLWSGFR